MRCRPTRHRQPAPRGSSCGASVGSYQPIRVLVSLERREPALRFDLVRMRLTWLPWLDDGRVLLARLHRTLHNVYKGKSASCADTQSCRSRSWLDRRQRLGTGAVLIIVAAVLLGIALRVEGTIHARTEGMKFVRVLLPILSSLKDEAALRCVQIAGMLPLRVSHLAHRSSPVRSSRRETSRRWRRTGAPARC